MSESITSSRIREDVLRDTRHPVHRIFHIGCSTADLRPPTSDLLPPMSIYATLWSIRFPQDGFTPLDDEWVEVTAQAVPPHIGSPTPGEGYEDEDPFAAFLPPPVETDAPFMRAVVIVARPCAKGTPRGSQEYPDPLLVLTGREYAAASFEELLLRITQRIHERHQLESLRTEVAHP